jgi:hypothetical protein
MFGVLQSLGRRLYVLVAYVLIAEVLMVKAGCQSALFRITDMSTSLLLGGDGIVGDAFKP